MTIQKYLKTYHENTIKGPESSSRLLPNYKLASSASGLGLLAKEILREGVKKITIESVIMIIPEGVRGGVSDHDHTSLDFHQLSPTGLSWSRSRHVRLCVCLFVCLRHQVQGKQRRSQGSKAVSHCFLCLSLALRSHDQILASHWS